MIEGEKQVENASIDEQIEVDSVSQSTDTKSTAFEYSEKLSLYHSYIQEHCNKTIVRLQKQKMINSQSKFTNKLKIKLLQESINKEVIIIQAQWGCFCINIKILNIQGENIKHIRQSNKGMHGIIYCGDFNKKSFVIKCIPVVSKNSRCSAIKEWFLMKVASVIGVGPQILDYFGFDILMFSECIEFGMQECEKVTVHNSRTHQFYENIGIMHKFHIVHQDIKPQNILYSPSFGRPVLIDFGLSRIISEQIGFKTLTNYVGTMNYWSPEMAKCYAEKKQRLIDLYYNDIHCMEKTLEVLKQYQGIYQFDLLDQLLDQTQNFEYLSLYLGKYYLFHNSFDKFRYFYQKQMQNKDYSDINFYQTEILNFFQELSPTKQVKSFFNTFVTQKHKQTMLFNKLKILYQISDKNLCSLQIFRNQEKHNIFQNICIDIVQQQDYNYPQKEQKGNIIQMMTNVQLIKEKPYQDYLKLYLNFSSYICDIFSVSSEQRRKAALTYHRTFIGSVNQEQTTKQIVASTILHALDYCLNKEAKQKTEIDQLVYLLFKIYDFLVILDMGQSDQFMKWLNNILFHPSIDRKYSILFLERVNQSNNINLIRIKPKKNVDRYSFFLQVQDWAINKFYLLKQRQSNLQKQIQNIEISQLPYQFQKDFGLEITLFKEVGYWKNDMIQNSTMLIDMYYKLLQINKNQKILYFLPFLYRDNLYRGNPGLCQQIQNIFKTSIRDPTIINEFSFYFEKELVENKIIKDYKNHKIILNLRQINQFLLQIKTNDFYLIDHALSIIWNKVQEIPIEISKQLSFHTSISGVTPKDKSEK